MKGGGARYLLVVHASYGHLFPAIKLAHILQARGHQVLFVSSNEYNGMFSLFGIENVGVSNTPTPFLALTDWYELTANLNQVRVLEQVIEQYKPDRLVTNPLVLSSFLVAEKHSIPVTVVGYCEYLYPAADHRPSPKQWRLDTLTKYYNAVRESLDLSEVAADPVATPLIGDRYLLRTVPDLVRERVLPEQVECVGGLYWEPQYINVELRKFVRESRKAQKKLAYVQIGRLFDKTAIWSRLLGALGELPFSFVLDVGRADYIEPGIELPDNCLVSPFIPLGPVAADMSAVICSGQTTSVVSALLHGKFTVCVPFSADSIELSESIEKKQLGVGIYSAEEITAERLAAELAKASRSEFRDCIESYRQTFLDYEVREEALEI